MLAYLAVLVVIIRSLGIGVSGVWVQLAAARTELPEFEVIVF
jgi:hypothetical protein